MCGTCDFVMPGNVHLCPVCVLAPARKDLSKGRKGMLVTAYALAVWNTFGLILLSSGALASSTKEAQAIMGILISVFIFLPSVVGTALCISIFERRRPTPDALWGATIWNCLITAALVLLVIVTNFMK
jgi:uncharacterized membrane protein YeaQ/YmgE (transglycosylase-associated protein family)